jgi:hypothetical protein
MILFLLGMALAAPSAVQDARDSEVPWGVSSSASSFRNYDEWLPKMSTAGVRTVRLFPEWGGLQPAPETWTWTSCDAMVKSAAAQKIEINAILMGKAAWTQGGVHAFPMKNLAEWSTWVGTTVGHYKDQIRYWEVWNEGNAGFNDGHHTTADYARLAIETYAAAKKADPHAQVGLTVASFDAPYLQQAIRAQAEAGQPDSFDYLCIHPYEIADEIVHPNGEIPYLWMTGRIRQALKNAGSGKSDAPLWITEVGRRLDSRKGQVVTEADAAQSVVKLYTMALAQGIRRIQWFEAQDPVGEDQGFGLLGRSGQPRASYAAFQTMTLILGQKPRTLGWLALGARGRGYGFVFQGATGPVLVAWMPGGETDASTKFKSAVEVLDPAGAKTPLQAGQPLSLRDTPVFVVGLPADLLQEAQGNRMKAFPWGGDYSAAKTVRLDFGSPADPAQGLFPTSPPALHTFADGSQGLLVVRNAPTNYFVHPSFASLGTSEYYVRITVRRIVPGGAGMNCIYEVADSQGRSPYRNRGEWFGLSPEEGWQTHTWHLKDAGFSTMWGFDIGFRPEQSVSFAIGKVEVSTEPLK